MNPQLRTLATRTLPSAFRSTSPIPEPVAGSFERLSTPHGDVWFRSDDDVIRPAVALTGSWEPHLESLVKQLLEPGTRFLDIGANIGWFSVLVASLEPTATIDAVEPVPASLSALRMNLWLHAPTATIHGCALGAERGVVAIEEAAHNPGDARTVESATTATVLAPVLCGDELFGNRRFDLVKIDVQGGELDVMVGLRRTFARSGRVRCLLEFQPSALADRHRRPGDVLNLYRSLGFEIQTQVGDRLLSLSDDETIAACVSAGEHGYVTLLLTRHR